MASLFWVFFPLLGALLLIGLWVFFPLISLVFNVFSMVWGWQPALIYDPGLAGFPPEWWYGPPAPLSPVPVCCGVSECEASCVEPLKANYSFGNCGRQEGGGTI